MYDDDIDVSVSVNSTYPMNYISSMLIDDFDRRPEKDVKRGLYASQLLL